MSVKYILPLCLILKIKLKNKTKQKVCVHFYSGSDAGQDGPNIDHFDFGVITPKLHFLEELHLTYG